MCESIGHAIELGLSRRGFLKLAPGAAAGAGLASILGQPVTAAELAEKDRAVAASKQSAKGFDTRLVLLGTAGGPVWWPNCDREGISSAVVVGDAVYVVDCGD